MPPGGTPPPIVGLCHAHGVARLDAFGSILRSDFDVENGDIDLPVEFQPSRAADFGKFLELKESLVFPDTALE
jgi:predicted nucleotidyltransferase